MNLINEQLNSTASSILPAMAGSQNVDGTAQQPLATDGALIEQDDPQRSPARREAPKRLSEGDIYQPAMRIEIPAVPIASTETTDGFFKLRPWQLRCSTELAGQRNFILNAPTAAGKAFALCTIAAERLQHDPDLKVVIAVPQGIIGAGFRNNKIEMPDGSRIYWELDPEHDLCSQNLRHNTVRLLKFLNGPASAKAMGRIVLCTHATLVRAFRKDPSAFKNILIIIDEAHHVQHATNQDQQIDMNNKLGELVKHVLQNREGIQVGLATATFFRGDSAPIIPDDAEFARFDLAYDEYLETCQFLRTFSYDFVISRGSFADPLRHLFDRRIGKTIVYIPAVNSSSSLGTKTADVNVVLQAIAGTDTPTLADIDKPIMQVKRGDEWVRVVNLVDETNRAAKTEAIIAAHSASEGGDIDVVIALGMLKEGANWRWADREVIIGHRGSLTEILQMVGRILRDVAGKTSVEVFHVLPFRFGQLDRERTREELNDYLAAILLSMLLENVISPVYSPPEKSDGGRGDGVRRINYLKEAFAEEGQAIAAVAEITTRVVDASSAVGVQALAETFPAIVSEVLTAKGIHEYHGEIARQLFRMFNRRTAALDGDVGHVDVDLIKENPFGCLLQYASGACGINTFRELRAASRARAFMPFAQARAFVHSLRFKSAAEWREYCASGKKPSDLPSNPNVAYAQEGWVSFTDWLGTHKRVAFSTFQDARHFVQSLGLTSVAQWQNYCLSRAKPANIPRQPDQVYKGDGWCGYGDWLGTGRVRSGWRPFEEAREFVRGLGLKSMDDWKTFSKSDARPVDIPTNPNVTYTKAGWSGFGDWLGTARTANCDIVFRPFPEARKWVHGLRLKSQAEWLEYCKSGRRPADIPHHPARTYKAEGWSDWGDWLGTGNVANRGRRYRNFYEARQYVQNLGLNSFTEWRAYSKSGKRPPDIPSCPARIYKDKGWVGFGDWLGTGRVADRDKRFLPFDKAREHVRTLGLRTVADWKAYAKSGKRSPDIPAAPDHVYRDTGWAGFNDWLMGESGLASVAA